MLANQLWKHTTETFNLGECKLANLIELAKQQSI